VNGLPDVTGFEPLVSYPSEVFQVLTSGDFDEDGYPDLISVDDSRTHLGFQHNLRTRNIAAPVYFGNVNEPSDAVAGYFNADDHLDLAVTNEVTGTVSIFLGNGTGGFASPLTVQVGAEPDSIRTGYFDQGSTVDLLVANTGTDNTPGSVNVLRGNGNGTFIYQPVYALPNNTNTIASAVAEFFNNDAYEDIVVVESDGTRRVFLGSSNGSFQAGAVYPGQEFIAPNIVETGDFNNDSRPDLLTTNVLGDVSIYPGNGDGTFGNAILRSLDPALFSGISVVDVNEDGNADLIANEFLGDTKVYRGLGDGTFDAGVGISSDVFDGSKLVLDDFDRNGAVDIANAVGVLYNRANAPISLTGENVAGVQGTSLANVVLGHFSDPDIHTLPASYAVNITWGDGNTGPGTVVANAAGGFDVVGNHTYVDPGDFFIRIKLIDGEGGITTAEGAASIGNVAPTILDSSLQIDISQPAELQGFALTGTFSDVSPNEAHLVTINWGDASPVDYIKVPANFHVFEAHMRMRSAARTRSVR
jgi:hypothetical protein